MEGILRNMYIDGDISEEKYQSGLISIASSYALIDHKTEATQLISRLSTKFLNDLPNILKTDEGLRAKALLVAEYINDDSIAITDEEAKIDLLLAGMDHSQQPS